jgi:hypothetical protein
MTNELPEVGSRWTIDGANVNISAVKKKGRGYYVLVNGPSGIGGPAEEIRYRLQDFRKKAKAAE